jgi:hypothetical protein
MEPLTLPFDAPLAPDRPRRRPYRRATLAAAVGAPWQGTTPQSAHASLEGARAVQRDQVIDQASRYWRLLRARGARGATDWEAHEARQIQRSSINARRAELVHAGVAIAPAGFRPGPTGIKNVVWVLAAGAA